MIETSIGNIVFASGQFADIIQQNTSQMVIVVVSDEDDLGGIVTVIARNFARVKLASFIGSRSIYHHDCLDDLLIDEGASAILTTHHNGIDMKRDLLDVLDMSASYMVPVLIFCLSRSYRQDLKMIADVATILSNLQP